MRYSTLLKNLQRLEQKLDNLVLYVDFFPNRHDLPVILMKDGIGLTLHRYREEVPDTGKRCRTPGTAATW